MDIKIKSNTYKPYISGLKGFACFMVMFGHYIELFKVAENFPVESNALDVFKTFIDSKIGFLLDETFWVILFFVISGYLVAMSNIATFKDMLTKNVMRFLRLGIPILCAYVVIFLIYKTLGFHTLDTMNLFENSFIQKHYLGTYSIWNVLKSPIDVLFLGKFTLNAPYWVLREMFISSILIYFFTWLRNKLSKINVFWIALFLTMAVSMVVSNIVFAGLFGMLICLIEKDKGKEFLSNKLCVFALTVFCGLLYFIPRSRISCVFFGAIILFIPKLPIVNKVISSKFACFFGKISFGIYSLHWPVFFSFGMLIISKTTEKFGLLESSVLAIIISIAITVLLSILYYYGIEKHIYKLLKILERAWRKRYE